MECRARCFPSLRSGATTVNARIVGWHDQVGTLEKGKFGDLIARTGDPLDDITEMQARPVRHEGRRRNPKRFRSK